jgi:hypothetical protein
MRLSLNFSREEKAKYAIKEPGRRSNADAKIAPGTPARAKPK